MQVLRAMAACRSTQLLTQTVEGMEGLLLALERAVKSSAPIRVQLQLLHRPPGHPTNSIKPREMCCMQPVSAAKLVDGRNTQHVQDPE